VLAGVAGLSELELELLDELSELPDELESLDDEPELDDPLSDPEVDVADDFDLPPRESVL
jgi:hypothetical protein